MPKTSLQDARAKHPAGTPVLLRMRDGRDVEARLGEGDADLDFEDADQPAVDVDQIDDVLIGEDSEGPE